MSNPNYIKARKMASEILLLQEDLVFPIDVEKIKLKDKSIVFSSYQNYAEKTGINISDLNPDGKYNDAMVFSRSVNEKLILYNSEIYSKGRILWNKAHELGHIVLDHKEQGESEEIEANTFASQLLLPQCLLKNLIQNNLNITPEYLVSKFGLSNAAAESCLKLVCRKLENDYDATYDDIILFKCRDFLNNEIKKNIRSRYYDNDISDEERNNWLNDL
jgi:Zn-dependent peptidase ImmA (M78 family)